MLKHNTLLIVWSGILLLGALMFSTSTSPYTFAAFQSVSTHAIFASPGLIQGPAHTLSPSNGGAMVVSPPPTKVVHFSPSGIKGTLNALADCWRTSTSAPRANAWRCGVKQIIHDPCFSTSAQETYVICDADPTGDGRGLKATLAHPLPASTYSRGMQAWVIRLSNSSVCTFANGATGLFGGERLNYSCTSGWWIVGSPRTGPVWMVRLVKWGQSPQTQPVMMSVLEVWW